MGTRGFLGFVADGAEKISYCHFDSYPSGLGLSTLRWLRAAMDAPDALRKHVVELRVVDPDSHPTEADIERLSKYADTGVSTRRLDDWYVLLRETQGNPHAMLDAGVIEDAGAEVYRIVGDWGSLADLAERHLVNDINNDKPWPTLWAALDPDLANPFRGHDALETAWQEAKRAYAEWQKAEDGDVCWPNVEPDRRDPLSYAEAKRGELDDAIATLIGRTT